MKLLWEVPRVVPTIGTGFERTLENQLADVLGEDNLLVLEYVGSIIATCFVISE